MSALRSVRADATVFVELRDYQPGDDFWFLGTPHRIASIYPLAQKHPKSPTAKAIPGIHTIACKDMWTTNWSGHDKPTEARHAPPGYFTRTNTRLDTEYLR